MLQQRLPSKDNNHSSREIPTFYRFEVSVLREQNITFCRNGKHCQKARTTDKPRKNKIYDSGKEKHIKTRKKLKNYKFKRAENFKYLGVILHEYNNSQIHLQERIKMLTKLTSCYLFFSKIKTYKKVKLTLKNTIIDKTLTYASET
jgi:hypothetical protein